MRASTRIFTRNSLWQLIVLFSRSYTVSRLHFIMNLGVVMIMINMEILDYSSISCTFLLENDIGNVYSRAKFYSIVFSLVLN